MADYAISTLGCLAASADVGGTATITSRVLCCKYFAAVPPDLIGYFGPLPIPHVRREIRICALYMLLAGLLGIPTN